MKNKIKIGLLVFMVSMNVVGCGGCGTTREETSVVAEMEETEKVIEETEVTVTEALEEDYADSLVEVEGGDGEDSTETDVVTEEVVESTETEEVVESTETPVENTNLFNIVDCDPVTKYTNTNANIRAIPDKSGELINTVDINTALVVTGTTDNGWSRTENCGLVCYIKSSLLSDTMTVVEQSSSQSSQSSGSQSSSDNQSAQSNGGTSQPSSQPSQPSTPNPAQGDPDPADFGWEDGYTNAGEVPSGGTTGSNAEGHNYGGGY